ncbi:MAG: DUF4380 domain-containing protein [Phycisphaerales bacterium]|nr:DUF4380 domain-containing protein [Phycisphaerales bacterium]
MKRFSMSIGWAFTLTMTWVLLLTGCATPPQQLVFDRFTEAYRLTNGTVQVTVVPQVGRVVSYSMTDGSGELIWWNPAPDLQSKYTNYGGNKAWPWPQSQWQGIWGGTWPPPPGLDGQPYIVTYADKHKLSMISQVDEKLGLQLEYQVELDQQGTGVTMRYTLIRVDLNNTLAWGAWHVTQVRMPDTVLGRIPQQQEPKVQEMMPGKAWKSVTQVAQNVLRFERDPAVSAKLGFNANRLLAAYKDWAISITMLPGTSPGEYVLDEKAQLFVTTDAKAPKTEKQTFMELEFTSPKLPLEKMGNKVTLVTRWELHHQPKATLEDWVKLAGSSD